VPPSVKAVDPAVLIQEVCQRRATLSNDPQFPDLGMRQGLAKAQPGSCVTLTLQNVASLLACVHRLRSVAVSALCDVTDVCR
jgi:hypothetical protein